MGTSKTNPATSAQPPAAMGRLSFEVYEVLSQHAAFPWPIMRAQCRRRGIDPTRLTSDMLADLVHDLALGVARFKDMNAGVAVRRQLIELLRGAVAEPRPVLRVVR